MTLIARFQIVRNGHADIIQNGYIIRNQIRQASGGIIFQGGGPQSFFRFRFVLVYQMCNLFIKYGIIHFHAPFYMFSGHEPPGNVIIAWWQQDGKKARNTTWNLITLYAYQRECNFPVCYIIDPETGLSIDTVNYPLSVAHRHISRNAIKALKQAKEDCGNEKYKRKKKEFIEADRAEVLED